MERILIGRNNFALTVFMPDDCPKNCSFCTSKSMYEGLKKTEDLKMELRKKLVLCLQNPLITDVVFTGGEPLADMELLYDCVVIAKKCGKKVYVNTLMLSDYVERFNSLIAPIIDGVSVSRQTYNFDFSCSDVDISKIKCRTRINVMIPELDDYSVFIRDTFQRWDCVLADGVGINFRADYRYMDRDHLHEINDKFMLGLSSMNQMILKGRSYCDVCDTTTFELCDESGEKLENTAITYHRGLQYTSFEIGKFLIVNDAIFMPVCDESRSYYKLCYDWDGKSREEFDKMIMGASFSSNEKIGECILQYGEACGNTILPIVERCPYIISLHRQYLCKHSCDKSDCYVLHPETRFTPVPMPLCQVPDPSNCLLWPKPQDAWCGGGRRCGT